MKRYVFQVTFTDKELMGNEFWEEVINKESSGVVGLTEALNYVIKDQFLGGTGELSEDCVTLVKFERK